MGTEANRNVSEEIHDIDNYSDLVHALEDFGPPYPETPFGAEKTAELNVQFGIDPSFGLTKERYGWFSNETLFDSTFISESGGKIKLETGATGTDTARIRSAFPGRYLPHTVAEPGVGAEIASTHLEYDSNNFVSLTHGEISFDAAQWSDSNVRALNSIGISFESDATYFQVRSGDTDVLKVSQDQWNIDKMNGQGPSGKVLRPEKGYVYLFLYSWYGEGACILALQDPEEENVLPVHRYVTGENSPHVESPNLPVQVTVENQGTADPLSCIIGGMQYTTHGVQGEDTTRTTEEFRQTGSSYIATNAVTTNNAIDPFAEPGVPLISVRRDPNSTETKKGLSVKAKDLFADVTSDVYVFLFDEYNPASSLSGQNFGEPISRNSTNESGIETDTSATGYTPSSDAIIRAMSYIPSSKNQARIEVAGDVTSQIPLGATSIATAVLAPGETSTGAQPFGISVQEGF